MVLLSDLQDWDLSFPNVPKTEKAGTLRHTPSAVWLPGVCRVWTHITILSRKEKSIEKMIVETGPFFLQSVAHGCHIWLPGDMPMRMVRCNRNVMWSFSSEQKLMTLSLEDVGSDVLLQLSIARPSLLSYVVRGSNTEIKRWVGFSGVDLPSCLDTRVNYINYCHWRCEANYENWNVWTFRNDAFFFVEMKPIFFPAFGFCRVPSRVPESPDQFRIAIRMVSLQKSFLRAWK